MSLLLQVALNGSRSVDEHPGVPRMPEALAKEARAAVAVGARVIHLHAYDSSDVESLAAEACAAALRAVRHACPGVPVSFTTSAGLEPDPSRRFALVEAWTELPDLVTANQGEEGILELCDLLLRRGAGIEAGLLSVGDAEAFVRSGLSKQCVRVLIEPLEADPDEATAHAAAIENVLIGANILLEQVHHGDLIAS